MCCKITKGAPSGNTTQKISSCTRSWKKKLYFSFLFHLLFYAQSLKGKERKPKIYCQNSAASTWLGMTFIRTDVRWDMNRGCFIYLFITSGCIFTTDQRVEIYLSSDQKIQSIPHRNWICFVPQSFTVSLKDCGACLFLKGGKNFTLRNLFGI